MDKYHYDHRPITRRRRPVLFVLVLSLLIIGGIGGLVWRDMNKNKDAESAGATRTILQAGQEPITRLSVNEPTFSLELPGDWKELSRKNEPGERSITWLSTKKPQEGRTLTLHIDTIPTTRPINRLLPVTVEGNSFVVGELSENCATFTQGGTLNVFEASKLKPTPAKWKKVDFLCNLPLVNDNEVGTGSLEGNNTVTVTGKVGGAHKYFFVFIDHSSQANYEIFKNTVSSFKAK